MSLFLSAVRRFSKPKIRRLRSLVRSFSIRVPSMERLNLHNVMCSPNSKNIEARFSQMYFKCSALQESLHGHDSYFIDQSAKPCAFGVFDGVGGWVNQAGGDPKAFSQNLADNCAKRLQIEDGKTKKPWSAKELLVHGANQSMDSGILGSTTALICMLVDYNLMTVANMGDSKMFLFRQFPHNYWMYSLYFQSAEQIAYFNAPIQIGPRSFLNDDYSLSRDPSIFSEVYKFPLFCGDIVVSVTDGISDNLFDKEVEHIVNSYYSERQQIPLAQPTELAGEYTEAICHDVLELAIKKAHGVPSETETPFGRPKPDDCTCVVALVGNDDFFSN